MDVDQVSETVAMQSLLAKRTNKLDAIKNLDQKLLKKTANREKQDKDRRI